MIPTVTLDDMELGPRAALGLRRENRGLSTQRRAAITERVPRWGWSINWGADGMARSMNAVFVAAYA